MIRKSLILILFFTIFSTVNSQSLVNLRAELDKETYQQWDNYIKKYAPSDSAFNVVTTIVRRHYFAGRSAVCRMVLEMYRPLFPQKDTLIENAIKTHTEIMLTQFPTYDMIPIYDKFIKQNAPSMNAFVAVERLAADYIEKKYWDSAYAVYAHYLPFFPELRERFDKVMAIIKAPVQGLKIHNLGPVINTDQAEWDPNPTADSRFLFFSSSFRKGGYGRSDIWLSELKDGAWTEPKPLNERVNGKRDETIDNISIDGASLLLSGDFPGTYGNFDIYRIEVNENGWGEFEHFPRPVNSQYTDEAANLTSDGNAILFTSDRPGGVGEYHPMHDYFHGNRMGNMDIYVSLKTDSGWSEPINLGNVVNTPYAERSPYLHPDGRTLYFSSDGHPGIGKLDVFKTVRLNEDSWTEWSRPVNLGKEINTEKDDWGYKIGITGDSAFFAAQNKIQGYGDWDLYSIKLPDEAKPDKLVTIRGKVIDSEGRPLAAEIIWEDLSTGREMGHLKSNPKDGFYIIALPLGKNYGYFASRKGYYSTSNNIDLSSTKTPDDIHRNIVLISLKEMEQEDKEIRINNVFFDYDKFELKPQSYLELNRLVNFLSTSQNKDKKIEIAGHTDNIGTKEYNLELSRKRARAVADYLIKNGLPEERFIIKGYGAEKPVANNQAETGRALNRRVEVKFKE